MSRSDPLPRKILIVDDDEDMRVFLVSLLSDKGFEPISAGNGEEALTVLRQAKDCDLMLLDLNLPGITGMGVLREALKVDNGLPIIMVTGNGTISSAVEAVKIGAYDYVTKPFANEELVLKIRRGLESRRLRQENSRLRSQIDRSQSLQEQMGSSDPIRKVFADVERVAPTDFTVVIFGETGAGKELVARGIHRQSPRAAEAFVTVDCGAIPATLIESELFGHEKGAFTGADRTRPGKFEAASGGTLFLDEVQNLPLPVQMQFLRALQERQIFRVGGEKPHHIDIRVIAAGNKDLRAQVAAGRFREDLFHRLNEFSITLPPLRARRDDIIYLAKRFLDQTCHELKKSIQGITNEALDVLLGYDWPGNVRELRNVMRRAVLVAETHIGVDHLAIRTAATPTAPRKDVRHFDGPVSFKELVRQNLVEVERDILIRALEQTGGNKAKAARMLQIDYKTIHVKAKEYGIQSKKDEE